MDITPLLSLSEKGRRRNRGQACRKKALELIYKVKVKEQGVEA
jgi:hypothetical protein